MKYIEIKNLFLDVLQYALPLGKMRHKMGGMSFKNEPCIKYGKYLKWHFYT